MQFKNVVGQAVVKEKLIQAATEGRVSHALLFFGPRGSGTMPLAMAFAQYLLCENPGQEDSCGVCPGCVKVSKLVHPDIHYVFPVVTSSDVGSKPVSDDYIANFRTAILTNPYIETDEWVSLLTGGEAKNKQGNISAEEAQSIIRKISLKNFEGKYKIVFIWSPEKMNAASANKLLKSIEEPPDNTVFILAAEQRDQIISTILSRTQQVKVVRPRDEEVAAALCDRYGIQPAEAREMARLADGDFRLAQELADTEKGEGNYEQDFLNWMRLCFNPMNTMDKLQAWVEGMAAEPRERQKQFLFSSMQTLRECLLMNTADFSMVRIDDNQQQALQRFLPFVTENNVDGLVSTLNDAYYHIERNAYPKILFLDLSLKMSRQLQQK